ncbi:MAG: Minf_1886 family protein [Candidatus Omnitrophota bacterium]|jgi:uncharacterized repeat protein (TIGR04138 family)
MKEKKDFYQVIEDICSKDPRYKPDAYEFVMQALYFTQKKIKRQGHMSGKELLQGIRDFAAQEYGPMAKTLLYHWGITKTDDFGNIVFNMIEKKVLSKNEDDSVSDFKNVYDFEKTFGNILRESVIREMSKVK